MVPSKVMAFLSLLCLLSVLEAAAYPEGSCGTQGGGALCTRGMCCSNAGYCGYTDDYCAPGHCQSQCPGATPPPPPPPPPPPCPPPSRKDISSIFPRSMFEAMFPHRNTFYKYDDFITATKAFPAFASSDDKAIQLKEIAAFFGQTSQETSVSWDTAPDPYFWGYFYVEEIAGGVHCQDSVQWPCAPGKEYFGRGPIQLSYNYNYGPCGAALGLDLLHNPELVSSDGVVSFKAALWFWMTPQGNKPSCHAVITGQWTPSPADVRAGRRPGYGVLTNIINGGVECGPGASPDGRRQSQNRIRYYENYCGMLQVIPGPNLDCDSQTPFGFGALVNTM